MSPNNTNTVKRDQGYQRFLKDKVKSLAKEIDDIKKFLSKKNTEFVESVENYNKFMEKNSEE